MKLCATTGSRYGWIVVGAGTLSIAVQTSIFYSTGLFLVTITSNTGWSRTAVSVGISLLALGNGVWAPVVGLLVRAWGPRRVIPLAALLVAGGLLVVSIAQNPLMFSLAMLFLVALGSIGLGPLSNYAAIQAWFLDRRGVAFALADTGSSIGIMLLMPLAQQFVFILGWRGAYQALAAIVLLLAPLHLLIQRQPPQTQPSGSDRNASLDPSLTVSAILYTRKFWLIFLGLWTSWFAAHLIMGHQVAYLTDHRFASPSINAGLATIGLAGMVGRIGFGWLSDKVGIMPAFALVIACMVTGIGSLIAAGETGLMPLLLLFGVLFGCSLGVSTILFARIVTGLFGSRNFGAVMGLAYVGASLGGASGPASAGMAFDATGSYLSSFGAAAIAAVLSFACLRALNNEGTQSPRKGQI